MRLSIPLSIHNRAALFRRALPTYLWQTLPPEEWEIILVDDSSTEDQMLGYGPFLGRLNIRHVIFDHTRHPLFQKKNPGWKPGMPKNWWKTPALTTNLGCYLARAPIVGLFHPEVMHAPANFEKAVSIVTAKPSYLFGKVWLGSPEVNQWLSDKPDWSALGWSRMLTESGAENCRFFKEDERYWYCSFLPREAVRKIRGVDFQYMEGNSYEDCDFKERVNRAGCSDVVDFSIQGLHQDHSDEKDAHRVRDAKWLESEVANGQLFRTRLYRDGFPNDVNWDNDWTAKECVVKVIEYHVGRRQPYYEGPLP